MSDADLRAVLFDLDHTLCEYNRSGADLLAEAFDNIGRDQCFTAEEYYEVLPNYIDHDQHPTTWREQAFVALAEDRGFTPAVGKRLAREYAELRDHEDVSLLSGVDELLDAFDHTYRLGVVTNGHPTVQRQKISALDLGDFLQTVVYAGHDTPTKPDPAPFELACEQLRVEPAQALMVGDSLRADVAGAHNAGLRSAWLAKDRTIPADATTPDYELDSVLDLLDVCACD